MAVSINGQIDYSNWRKLSTREVSRTTSSTAATSSQSDTYVSSETCTDGKDDGKIGFFSAIGNAVKGIGKTIVNGVKGMFTNSEGKFSLGKTLLSIGTAALCVAVPAVGVAACVVGGTMGAIQVGKGIYNAATAETDAEAKEAWQNIGGGAFTVGMSIVGAKAGVKGMKSAAAKTDAGSALQALSDSGTKLTTKTAGQYAKAFVQDGYRSGKYNLGQIKTTATAYAKTAKETVKETREINKMRKANAKALAKQEAGKTLTETETQAISNWDNLATKGYSEKALNIAQKQNELGFNLSEAAKHPLQTAKNAWTSAKGAITKDNASQIWNSIKSAPKTAINALKNLDLKGTQAQIAEALTSGETTYAQAVQEYGYENVAQVLQYLGGTLFSSESV